MFEILSQFIFDSLSKVIEHALESKTASISRKRSLLSKLLALYDTIEELEIDSVSTYKELISYANRSSVPTKTVTNKYLSKLAISYKDYVSALNEVENMLSIYDRPLMAVLSRARTGKSSLLTDLSRRREQDGEVAENNIGAAIELTSEAYPKQIRDDGKLTFNISYPTKYPSTSINLDQYRSLSKSELEKEARKLRGELKKSFNLREIDLRSPEKLEKALIHGENNILLISESRQQLANFIKENFPLEKLLDER